jgi:hypothetical protein
MSIKICMHGWKTKIVAVVNMIGYWVSRVALLKVFQETNPVDIGRFPQIIEPNNITKRVVVACTSSRSRSLVETMNNKLVSDTH